MSFLSLEFSVFFLCLFPIYWSLASRPHWQNILLTVVGLGCLVHIHELFALAVLMFSTAIYAVAAQMSDKNKVSERKYWLRVGIVLALTNLSFFKYFDFFRPQLHRIVGESMGALDIALPLGISYYTFQSIAYLVSLYRHEPVKLKWHELLLHFSFFPTVTSGPIIRAGQMKTVDGIQAGFAAQVRTHKPRSIIKPALALSLILLGVTKKWWLAGTLSAGWVTPVFENPLQYDVLSVLTAIYGYTVWLFFDFSGYTDLVIGIAMLLGFRLPQNFRMPLQASNIRSFWERWHISLSAWIRDYIYIPLGGSRKGFVRTQVNVMIAMLLSGIWHGYGWNFLLWGALHGLAFIGLNIADRRFGREALALAFPWGRAVGIFFTVNFVCFSFVVFATHSLHDAGLIFQALLGGGRGWVMPDLGVLTVLLLMVLSLVFYRKLVWLFRSFVRLLVRLPVWAWPFALSAVLLFLMVVAPSGIPGFIYANF
ncbi:MAG: MBOAT family O-acyltransferase [Conchiformibius sp.]|nr:MBOAT family O-acyltransferase [Conchiformibius sp.]